MNDRLRRLLLAGKAEIQRESVTRDEAYKAMVSNMTTLRKQKEKLETEIRRLTAIIETDARTLQLLEQRQTEGYMALEEIDRLLQESTST